MKDDLGSIFTADANEAFPIRAERISGQPPSDWLGCAAVVQAPLLAGLAFKDCVAGVERHPVLGPRLSEPAIGQRFLWAGGATSHPASALSVTFNALSHAALIAHYSIEGLAHDGFVMALRGVIDEIDAWALDPSRHCPSSDRPVQCIPR